MFKDEILENENRRSIYNVIDASPGVHLRELQRNLNMPLTTLEYHLGYMVRKQIIFGEAEGHFKRYYAKPLDKEDKKVLSTLRQRRMREIVLLVMANRKIKSQGLFEVLQVPRSTLSFYLKHLVDHGILLKEKVGYDSLFTVKDEDRVAKVLVAYKASFLDGLVDKTLGTWLEAYSKNNGDGL